MLGLEILLFVSFLTALFLIIVPLDEYESSPAAIAVDYVWRSIDRHLTSGRNRKIIEVLGKSITDVVKTGLLAGIGLALLGFLLGIIWLGPYTVVAAVGCFILGILLTSKVLENEYHRWQEKILEGIPALVNFMPAFMEVEGITVREAMALTTQFLPEPLHTEMVRVVKRIERTGKAQEVLDEFADRVNHPMVDAICFRLAAAWDTKVTSDIFLDLADQVEETIELAAARATTAKTGYFTLVSVLGLLGMMFIYAYPGFKYLMLKMSGGIF